VCVRARVCYVSSLCACQPYIAFDDMLLRGPTTTLSPTRSLQSTINYDMNSHYRFGGVAPQKDRDPMHAMLETRLLEFITKEGTPGVMPSEPKLRVSSESCLCRCACWQCRTCLAAHANPVWPQGAGQDDLIKGISGAGGWHKVARTLGLQISHTLREVYFKCPESKQAGQEIEFTMPGMPQRFAATIPEGVNPGDEFIVRVPPVLPSAAHGFARGLGEEEAKERLVLLAEEMDQMKLMMHEIKVIKQTLRSKDREAQVLRQRNAQLQESAQTEATRRAELAASLAKANAQFPLLACNPTAADSKPQLLSQQNGASAAPSAAQPADGQRSWFQAPWQ
jgi:hypothetical protein